MVVKGIRIHRQSFSLYNNNLERKSVPPHTVGFCPHTVGFCPYSIGIHDLREGIRSRFLLDFWGNSPFGNSAVRSLELMQELENIINEVNFCHEFMNNKRKTGDMLLLGQFTYCPKCNAVHRLS